MRNGATNIPNQNLFAVQALSFGRDSLTRSPLSIIRIIDNFQICFMRRRSKQGFRHVARAAEISVNYQQRFRRPLLLSVKRL